MSEFVVYSAKAGEKYHRIGDAGISECGGLSQGERTRRDGPEWTEGDVVETAGKEQAESEGYEPCAGCFNGTEADQ